MFRIWHPDGQDDKSRLVEMDNVDYVKNSRVLVEVNDKKNYKALACQHGLSERYN